MAGECDSQVGIDDRTQGAQRCVGSVRPAIGELRRDLRRPPEEHDKSFTMLGERLPWQPRQPSIGMRTAVSDRDDSAQRGPPTPALGEEDDPRSMLIDPLPTASRGAAGHARPRIREQRLDREIDAEHRRNRPSLTGPHPLHRSVQPVTVSEADDVVAVGNGPVDEPLRRSRAVLQRVARRHLQMRPCVCHESSDPSCTASAQEPDVMGSRKHKAAVASSTRHGGFAELATTAYRLSGESAGSDADQPV